MAKKSKYKSNQMKARLISLVLVIGIICVCLFLPRSKSSMEYDAELQDIELELSIKELVGWYYATDVDARRVLEKAFNAELRSHKAICKLAVVAIALTPESAIKTLEIIKNAELAFKSRPEFAYSAVCHKATDILFDMFKQYRMSSVVRKLIKLSKEDKACLRDAFGEWGAGIILSYGSETKKRQYIDEARDAHKAYIQRRTINGYAAKVGFLILVLLIFFAENIFAAKPVFKVNGDAGKIYVTTFVLWFLLYTCLSLFFPRASIFPENMTGYLLAYLASTLLGLTALCWPLLCKVPIKTYIKDIGLNFKGHNVFKEISVGVGAFFGLALTLPALLFNHPMSINPVLMVAISDSIWIVSITAFFIVVIGPIIEEIVFRGVLYAGVSSLYLSFAISTVATATVFTVIHGYSFEVSAVMFMEAVILAFLREFRQSIISCITLHGLSNGFILLKFLEKFSA